MFDYVLKQYDSNKTKEKLENIDNSLNNINSSLSSIPREMSDYIPRYSENDMRNLITQNAKLIQQIESLKILRDCVDVYVSMDIIDIDSYSVRVATRYSELKAKECHIADNGDCIVAFTR